MLKDSAFCEFRFSSTDGVMLYARKYGWLNINSTPVVCLPEFTGNCRQFHRLAEYLSSVEGGSHRVLTLDYRGRGKSDRDKNPANYNLTNDTSDVLTAITAAGLHTVNVIGTAYGGMIAMLLAAQRPSMLNSVILNEAGSQIPVQELVRQKRMLERISPAKNEQAAIDFVQGYMENFFPAFSNADWAAEIDSRYRHEKGKYVPDFDLRIAKKLKNINLDARIGGMWQEFAALLNIPVMVIYGETSEMAYHPALELMKQFKPDLVTCRAPGQGHAPRLHIGKLPYEISRFFDRPHAYSELPLAAE